MLGFGYVPQTISDVLERDASAVPLDFGGAPYALARRFGTLAVVGTSLRPYEVSLAGHLSPYAASAR